MLKRLLGRFRRVSPRPATEREFSILRAILAGGDERHHKLLAQMERAPGIERASAPADTFRVGPSSTFEDLLFPLELERVESEWLAVEDRLSGRHLLFRVVVGRHGFLLRLEGRTVDGGAWPSEWEPDIPDSAPVPMLTLPSVEDQQLAERRVRQALGEWLAIPLPGEGVVTNPPADAEELAATESRLRGILPTTYRQLLGISNGLRVGEMYIHGTSDMHLVDDPHLDGVLVAWGADESDDFVVVVSRDGREGVYRVDIHDHERKPIEVAADFRDYLVQRTATILRSPK